jgi:hypothetical protein
VKQGNFSEITGFERITRSTVKRIKREGGKIYYTLNDNDYPIELIGDMKLFELGFSENFKKKKLKYYK